MIQLSDLQDMFDNMRAKAPWNVDGPMLWGYFFVDPDARKLKKAAEHLVKEGYRFVDIHSTDDGSTCVLHVERVETHSPQTLFERNEHLYAVAADFGIESYDGMDVGPAKN